MGCALRTCRDPESETTSTIGESVQMVAISGRASRASQPSQTSHSSQPSHGSLAAQAELIPVSTESQRRRTLDDQRLSLIMIDVRESLNSLDRASLDVPSTSRGSRFQLARKAKTKKYLSEEDAYLAFQKKRASRTPSALSLLKRNLFYKSFPLTIARRKSVEKRMKKEKFGAFEQQRFIFKGRGRNSGASSGSGSSRGAGKSVHSLPPGFQPGVEKFL